jgi:hypothetical protein
MFPQILVDCPLEELNEVEFTVKFGEENAEVLEFLNCFLNQ